MKGRLCLVAMLMVASSGAQQPASFKPVPELAYRVHPEFFDLPTGLNFGEAASVAVDAHGHVFLFQRNDPMLCEYDGHGRFVRELGKGLFTTPHGLRIDAAGDLWTTDTGSHLVLKLSPEGRVLMVLGHKGQAAEGEWVFNRPADLGFDSQGNVYVADGYGNSRIVKFDKSGRFLTSWGKYGTGPGEFRLPHAVVVSKAGRVYVADRENARIQVFTEEGKFLQAWENVGYPFGLVELPNGHLLMADGGYDRVVELDTNGNIVGALGEPGHAPGQFAWAHALALGADRKLYVADTLNWRFQVFEPGSPSGKLTTYVPSVRLFNDTKPSTGWIPHQTGAVK